MREVDRALARIFARRGTGKPSAQPPAPHFAVAGGPEPAPLQWPETVRALERAHGERFNRLADSLLEARDRLGYKVFWFTACHRAEGRTTLVLTLARALARRPDRLLVVDADLGGPMLARQLGVRPRLGMDDVIQEGRAPGDALLSFPDDHLSLLPLRAPLANPRAALAYPAWASLLLTLRREFDLILLDGTPLLPGLGSAAPPPPPGVDAAILVRHRNLTRDAALRRAREALDAAGIPLLGLAETFVVSDGGSSR